MAEEIIDHKPEKAYFTRGDTKRKTPPATHVTSTKGVKVPGWIKRFEFFKSPSGSIDSKIVYNEYIQEITTFLRANPDKRTVTDIRKAVGVMVSPDGKEALTAADMGERVRKARESQQRPTVTEQGERVQTKKLPSKLQPAYKASF